MQIGLMTEDVAILFAMLNGNSRKILSCVHNSNDDGPQHIYEKILHDAIHAK